MKSTEKKIYVCPDSHRRQLSNNTIVNCKLVIPSGSYFSTFECSRSPTKNDKNIIECGFVALWNRCNHIQKKRYMLLILTGGSSKESVALHRYNLILNFLREFSN